MIQIDWQQILGYLLVIGGGLSGLVGLSYGLREAWKIRTENRSSAATRSADDKPPKGAVEWVADIVAAMGSAPDSSKLSALMLGSTRDEARSMRISELETKP